MDERRKPGWAFWSVVAMLVLPVLYGVLYFLLLERKVYTQTGIDPMTRQNIVDIEPQYRISEDWIRAVMGPAHQIDRQLRAEYWETVENSSGRKWKNPKPVSNSTAPAGN